MPAFPLFIDIKDKLCIVFGGGKVALRKTGTLLLFGADIVVSSPEALPELTSMKAEGRISLVNEPVKKLLERRPLLVICATDDVKFNAEVAKLCRESGIWVNSATAPEDSSFIFPAVTVRGNIVAGVSSSGDAPAVAGHVRQKIDKALPDWYAGLNERLSSLRAVVRTRCPAQKKRAEIMDRLLEYGLAHEGNIPDCIACAIIKDEEQKDGKTVKNRDTEKSFGFSSDNNCRR